MIEIKSTDLIREDHVAGMEAFRDEFADDDFYWFSRSATRMTWGSVTALPWHEGIAEVLV